MSSSARPDPARIHFCDYRALSARDSRAGMLRFWLVVGALDSLDVRKFRDVLTRLAARPRIWLTVRLWT